MEIYIAASWKHQHAVEMMTAKLREMGHTVNSFVEMNYGEDHAPDEDFDFEKWVDTPSAVKAFEYDTTSAITADLVIYMGNSGKDAAAECGMAYASGRPMVALWSKGEDFGLMRRMFQKWFTRHQDLIEWIKTI